MTIRVAINGYGRIGRNILRAHYEGGKKHDIQIVAINDLGDPQTNAHLTKYDTAHGRFPGTVTTGEDWIDAGRGPIRVTAIRSPDAALPQLPQFSPQFIRAPLDLLDAPVIGVPRNAQVHHVFA